MTSLAQSNSPSRSGQQIREESARRRRRCAARRERAAQLRQRSKAALERAHILKEQMEATDWLPSLQQRQRQKSHNLIHQVAAELAGLVRELRLGAAKKAERYQSDDAALLEQRLSPLLARLQGALYSYRQNDAASNPPP